MIGTKDVWIIMFFVAIITAAIFSSLVRTAANEQISSGESIIINNSSYKCTKTNTLE